MNTKYVTMKAFYILLNFLIRIFITLFIKKDFFFYATKLKIERDNFYLFHYLFLLILVLKHVGILKTKLFKKEIYITELFSVFFSMMRVI